MLNISKKGYVVSMDDGHKMQNTDGAPLRDGGWWSKMANCAVWIEQMVREHANTYKWRFAWWHANRGDFREMSHKIIVIK